MLIKIKRGWELPETAATPETAFHERRRLIKAITAGPVLLGLPGLLAACDEASEMSAQAGQAQAAETEADPSAHLYPVQRNLRYRLDRDLTPEQDATTYNNYYEFGSSKNVWRKAQALPIRPWMVTIDGMVEQPIEIGVDDLLAKMPLEERLYRHRCVEAWSMAVPWSGFPLKALVELAKPLFIATGIYGKPMPKQNGAPLRLAVPWKYGFKSTKGIVRFQFTDVRPVSFWEEIQASEYGFWANVNPEVPHPRWSQATERVLGSDERVPTQLYNGYGEYVAELYQGLEGERLFM
jgi:sulfoxide reductase catalytic subunit YedY